MKTILKTDKNTTGKQMLIKVKEHKWNMNESITEKKKNPQFQVNMESDEMTSASLSVCSKGGGGQC